MTQLDITLGAAQLIAELNNHIESLQSEIEDIKHQKEVITLNEWKDHSKKARQHEQMHQLLTWLTQHNEWLNEELIGTEWKQGLKIIYARAKAILEQA